MGFNRSASLNTWKGMRRARIGLFACCSLFFLLAAGGAASGAEAVDNGGQSLQNLSLEQLRGGARGRTKITYLKDSIICRFQALFSA